MQELQYNLQYFTLNFNSYILYNVPNLIKIIPNKYTIYQINFYCVYNLL